MPSLGALVLVAALVGAVVWLRPGPPPPAPTPQKDVVLQYADGSRLWSTTDGRLRSALVRKVVAELEKQGLTLDQLRSSGGAVVRTTIDAKAQAMAGAVVGRLVAPRDGKLGASVTGIEPVSGDVRVYLGLGETVDLAGGEPQELRPEIARPLIDSGGTKLVQSRMTPLDVTASYAAFAGGGVRTGPRFITSVTGADGAQLDRAVHMGMGAFDRQVAERVTAQLKENPACNGVACVPDAYPWMVGYTSQLAVTVFVDQAGAVVDDAGLAMAVWREFLASLAG